MNGLSAIEYATAFTIFVVGVKLFFFNITVRW